MKNILLLGNGFDLYYYLPTKYINFLRVIKYLQNNRTINYRTVGDVFSQDVLQKEDSFIAECYMTHQEVFDNVLLDENDVSTIISLTDNNLWFSYLNKVFNKDVGWIDFEKEIVYVLKCFERVLQKSTYVHFREEEKDVKYVVEQFGFYIDENSSTKVATIVTYKVNAEYCIETPKGSGKYVVNKKKVVDKLYKELSVLTEALRLYLKYFIENSLEFLKVDESYSRMTFLSHIHKTVTFNYTNTYEKLFYGNSTFHIHGNVMDKIVLGVGPDVNDSITSIDTTFIQFKKYFQRTLFETDYDYVRWMKKLVCENEEYRLLVIGHSLDDTDKDMINELFKKAKEIIIFYHNLDAHISYIGNLIKLFGKEKFDRLKEDSNLTFMSLDGDHISLKENLSKESWEDLYSTIDVNVDNQVII